MEAKDLVIPSLPIRPWPNDKPSLSDGALRLAAQVRANSKVSDVRVVMITPLSRSYSTLHVAYEAASALAQVGESPVLLIDLESTPAKWRPSLASTDPEEIQKLPQWRELEKVGSGERPPLTVIRPLAEVENSIATISSNEFVKIVNDARKKFEYVIVAADPVADSVGALVAAHHVDAVVLIVKGSDATTIALRNTRQALQRNQSKLLGFLYETK